jgi:exonuclease V gamma subunit
MPLILAETTAALLERMAGDLAACRDPWARHWLVLPGSGRSEWLQRRWARLSGIASHSQIVSLRSLIEQAASPEGEPFSRERLVLAVAQALPALANRMPLPVGAGCAAVDGRVLAWAEQVADAIDLGLLCRDGEDRWSVSPFIAPLIATKAVKTALAGHLGLLDRKAFKNAAERWIDQWESRGGVPKLWIELDAGLPQILLRCLEDLVGLLPDKAHLSLLSPSLGFWGDLRTRRRWTSGEDAGPVLTCLGRQAQDLHNQAIDCLLSHGSGGEELPAAALSSSLLGSLKESCRKAAAPETKRPLAPGDASFTVHSCRSALRELEVCRDRILQAMHEDPALAADDIVLLLADPVEQAPLVSAALAPLPVRVLGLGGAIVSPVATGLVRLLKALGGRLGLSDVQALIEEPLVAERFGFGGDVNDLTEWLEQAHFRWGVDASHRATVQDGKETRWNLAFALRRLGLGAVVKDDDRDGVVDGDGAPLDRASGLSTAALAQLATFANALYEARRQWMASAQPLARWCDVLSELVTAFLGAGNAEVSEQRTQLVDNIIPALVAVAPEKLLVERDAVLRLLEQPLEALTAGHGTVRGGITVAGLLHYAGTPARMVLVAGLGTETFPHREERPGWHPLCASRLLGDPDRRDADRHALLLALLGCGDRMVLTYQGGSDEDGKQRPPSTPLSDLLAAVDAVTIGPGGGEASPHILFEHGLNGFSPAACAEGALPSARSFLPSDYDAAATLIEPKREEYPGLWSQVLAPVETRRPLTLRDLTSLVEEPCRIFVRRLGLHLPEEAEQPSQEDVLGLDPLAAWALRDRLLQIQIAGGSEDVNAHRPRAERAGDLPRGLYGHDAWQEAVDQLPKITQTGLVALVESVQVKAGGRVIDGPFPSGFYRSPAGDVVYCSASTRSVEKILTLKIRLACLALAQDVRQVETWFKKYKTPKIVLAPARQQAEQLLARLCQLHDLGERLPLPFWPKAYEKMCEACGKGLPPERILSDGCCAWADGGYGDTAPPASSLPATRACFRGLGDPFTWKPDVEIDWLPDPAAPLAWRIFRFFQQWAQDADGGQA